MSDKDQTPAPSSLGVTCDPENEVAYITLVGPIPEGAARRQIMTKDGSFVLDLDANGALIGIELLSPRLLHPRLRAIARPR